MTKGADEKNRGQAYPAHLRALDDIGLVTALRDGCDDALAVLFERHSPLVFHIARTIVRDEGEAEETVQQVFFDLYRAIAQFKPERGTFKTWLLQFAYHRSINRRQHLSAKKFYNSEELDQAILAERIGRCHRVQDMSCAEAARLIEQLLGTLEPRQRRVIELTYFEGFTAEEVADRVGESAVVVRHCLYRGLSQLRRLLLKADKAKGEVSAGAGRQPEGILVVYPRTL